VDQRAEKTPCTKRRHHEAAHGIRRVRLGKNLADLAEIEEIKKRRPS